VSDRNSELRQSDQTIDAVNHIAVQGPQGRYVKDLDAMLVSLVQRFKDGQQRGFGLPGARGGHNDNVRASTNSGDRSHLHRIEFRDSGGNKEIRRNGLNLLLCSVRRQGGKKVRLTNKLIARIGECDATMRGRG
jgi:hypothetical protein